MLAQHPAVEKYKQAQRSVADDADASRLLAEFDRQLESLGRHEQSGGMITDAQRLQLESLQSKIVSHIKIKALNIAQVEFVDLLRKVSQTYQRPLTDQPAAGAAPAAAAGGPRLPCHECDTTRSGHPKAFRNTREGAMARWLLKTEPDCYSWDDLSRDKRTVWDGVTNALALKHIRAMKKGDLALIYHTGDERSAIGIAEVVSDPYPDPKEQEDKLVVVDVKRPKNWPSR